MSLCVVPDGCSLSEPLFSELFSFGIAVDGLLALLQDEVARLVECHHLLLLSIFHYLLLLDLVFEHLLGFGARLLDLFHRFFFFGLQD